MRKHLADEQQRVPIASGSSSRLGNGYGMSYYDGVGIVPSTLGSGVGQGRKRFDGEASSAVLVGRGKRGEAFKHVDTFKEIAGWAP